VRIGGDGGSWRWRLRRINPFPIKTAFTMFAAVIAVASSDVTLKRENARADS